ncbi:MAG: hypothetical protein Q6365_019045, partial [Candidatus Sigynarchaeota archaeon]
VLRICSTRRNLEGTWPLSSSTFQETIQQSVSLDLSLIFGTISLELRSFRMSLTCPSGIVSCVS